jgi:hypothetical protein
MTQAGAMPTVGAILGGITRRVLTAVNGSITTTLPNDR